MKYEKPKSGEWIRPVKRGYKMMYCDCGLVYTMDFRVVNNHAEYRVFRNNRSTALVRRHMERKNV